MELFPSINSRTVTCVVKCDQSLYRRITVHFGSSIPFFLVPFLPFFQLPDSAESLLPNYLLMPYWKVISKLTSEFFGIPNRFSFCGAASELILQSGWFWENVRNYRSPFFSFWEYLLEDSSSMEIKYELICGRRKETRWYPHPGARRELWPLCVFIQ